MNPLKRFLTLLLALTVVLCMAMPVCAAEVVASGTCGKNATWKLDSQGTLTISGTGAMDDYTRINPAPWNDYAAGIKKVIISSGTTTIGDCAFYGCDLMTSIIIPSSVTKIGNSAFVNCGCLVSITIPGKVTTIGESAFECCARLTSITIPASVTTIGEKLFTFCDSLTGIWVDENNKYYSSDNNGVLFDKNKTTVTAAPSTISGTYIIPNSVTTIGKSAFYFCSKLTGITIPSSVTSIESGAFFGCWNLTSITIPKNVAAIGDYAFSGCDSLRGIWVNKDNKDYISDDRGVLFNNNKTTLIAAPAGISGGYVIPSGVTSINLYAFYKCTQLTDITIPSSITSVGWCSFNYCTSLKNITFTGDAPGFEDYVFDSVTATAYYPANNATWTEAVRQNYGGNLTWAAYSKGVKPNKIVNVVSGIHVYWNKVSGVAKYGLWRSENGVNGTYKWVANPTVPHFTDTKVQSGKTYYYKVTTIDSNGNHSAKSDAIGLTYVSTPDISARYNKAAGVKLDWQKVTGATGYAIYRKSYSGTDAWVRVATISGNSTFTWTDTSVKNNNGTAYKYTIRALAGSDMKTLSGCRNAGRSMVRLTSRTLTGATKASATSVKCTWTTSSAVTGYEVRFMVGDQVYKTFTVGNNKTGVKTFTGLKAGQTYKIQVRSYKKIDGMGFYSAWSEAKYVTLLGYETFLKEKGYMADWSSSYRDPDEYCLIDIGQNGTDELIILSDSDDGFSDFLVYRINSNGNVVLTDGYHKTCYLGMYYSEKHKALAYNEFRQGSLFGGFGYYAFNGKGFDNIGAILYEMDFNIDNLRYYTCFYGQRLEVTEVEYNSYRGELVWLHFEDLP